MMVSAPLPFLASLLVSSCADCAAPRAGHVWPDGVSQWKAHSTSSGQVEACSAATFSMAAVRFALCFPWCMVFVVFWFSGLPLTALQC